MQSSSPDPEWTEHAIYRAGQRFPEYTLDQLNILYARSGRVGKKTRQKIKRSSPVAAKKYHGNEFNGRYHRISRWGVVFVIQAPETVVTLFRLNDPEIQEAK